MMRKMFAEGLCGNCEMPEPTAVAKYRRGERLHFCSRDCRDEFTSHVKELALPPTPEISGHLL